MWKVRWAFNVLSQHWSIKSESNNTIQLHNPLLSLGLQGDSEGGKGPLSIKVSKKTCLCDIGNEMEAAIIYLQDIPLVQTLNTPHSLIALWVVEPILLLFQHGSRIRSIKVMQHRRRTGCELFSGGRFEIF